MKAYLLILIILIAGCAPPTNTTVEGVRICNSLLELMGVECCPDVDGDKMCDIPEPEIVENETKEERPKPKVIVIPDDNESFYLKVGESISAESFDFTVSSMKRGSCLRYFDTRKQEDVVFSAPEDHKLVFVDVKVTNRGERAIFTDARFFDMYDDLGNLYTRRTSIYSVDDFKVIEKLNPDEFVEKTITFSLPENSTGIQFRRDFEEPQENRTSVIWLGGDLLDLDDNRCTNRYVVKRKIFNITVVDRTFVEIVDGERQPLDYSKVYTNEFEIFIDNQSVDCSWSDLWINPGDSKAKCRRMSPECKNESNVTIVHSSGYSVTRQCLL